MPVISKYNPKYHDAWAWSLAMKGGTDADIAAAFGITKRQLERWKQSYPSFAESLATGKEASDSEVEKSLYQQALGYEIRDVETFMVPDKNTGEMVVKSQREIVKHVPPSTMATMYWLNNRHKKTGEWAQRQEVQISGSLSTTTDLSNMSDEDLAALVKLAKEDKPMEGDG
ncbi:MAG: helix-turn-helix domain containing protein [Clostridia bacterium]|nr:helix-turn-helix domain containing protein [Clostridia bacterium]